MPGQTGSDQKERTQGRRGGRYVNSDLVHPCYPVSFHIALLLPVKVATGILMLT